MKVLEALEADHPPAAKLLSTTQAELDALAGFIRDHHISRSRRLAGARAGDAAFLRSTTSASMDIPGPFEHVATEAYYNMTLPDPKASAAETREFMRQWSTRHFQRLGARGLARPLPAVSLSKDFPSDVRKVIGAATNIEGWAHYCEQMVIDEGFHADDLRYRLAQIQDALLRDARFIVGIRMHTQGMTVAQAEEFFVAEGYQTRPAARVESKRGTSNPTYGYYTMGKPMILKLREDYRTEGGRGLSLQGFHDAFVRLGPLPLPLIRTAMLGRLDNSSERQRLIETRRAPGRWPRRSPARGSPPHSGARWRL